MVPVVPVVGRLGRPDFQSHRRTEIPLAGGQHVDEPALDADEAVRSRRVVERRGQTSLGRVEFLILLFARWRKDVDLAIVGGHDQILGTDHFGGVRGHIPVLPRMRWRVGWRPRGRR
jgi:hypothetical protein